MCRMFMCLHVSQGGESTSSPSRLRSWDSSWPDVGRFSFQSNTTAAPVIEEHGVLEVKTKRRLPNPQY